MLLLRAVVAEPQWALLDREEGCSHTGEHACCSLMLCCMLTLFAHRKVGQAAQESGGITVPGNVDNTCECGTWGHGLVVNLAVPSQRLDLMIFKGFSNLNSNGIL